LKYFRIKQWEVHQHYKDRSPPWIKLHRDLLTSQTWVMLDDDKKALAVACMLLAAGTDNKIPCDPAYIQRVAYLKITPELQPLLDCDFIEIIEEKTPVLARASKVIAIGTKRSSEESREEESRGDTRKRKSPKTPIPDDFDLTPERQLYAEKHLPHVDPIALMATFRSTSKAKGWEYVDWDQHWQTLVRQWAPNSGHWSSNQYPKMEQTRWM